jgi:hypothetical protein
VVRRTSSLLFVSIACIVAIALPASAKGGIGPLRKATIKGPGLDKPVTLKGGDGELLASHTDVVSGDEPVETSTRPQNLGPRYDMTFVYSTFEHGRRGMRHRRVVLHQELYPYAHGGPWIFTPAGQRLGDDPHVFPSVASGWAQGSDVLFDNLTLAWGLPAQHTSSTRSPASPSNEPTWPWLGGAAGLLVVGLGAALLLRTRRGAQARA